MKEELGYKDIKFRDLKEQPLQKSELKDLAKKAGGVDKIFSRRATKYRTLGLADKNLTDDQKLDWMAKEYTFISRPVIESDSKVVAGFSKRNYQEVLGI